MIKYLKKFAIAGIVVAGIVLAGCSDNSTSSGPSEYSVSGTVTDADGNAVPDVKLLAEDEQNDDIQTETNAEGQWSLDLFGEAIVTPRKSGLMFSPDTIFFNSNSKSTHEFVAEEIPTTEYTVDSSTEYQEIHGFGASIAWYGGWLVEHPNKNEIYDLIFKDLNISILRLQNWYGKENNVIGYSGEIVQKAEESLGHPIDVFITSWEAPDDLKSEDRDLSEDGTNITLKKEDGEYVYDQFADYWLNSLHAYEEEGIVPEYISIQNEPDYWPWGRLMPTESEDNAGYEYAGYDEALNAVYNKLHAEMASPPKISGPEVAVIDNNKVQGYTDELDLNQIEIISYHLYGPLPNEQTSINNFRNIASGYPDKPIFQTEYSNLETSALATTVYIHNTLVEGNVNAYLYWDLVWEDNGGPLVVMEWPWDEGSWTTEKGYYKNDQYYSVQHYSKFISPGYHRISVNSNGGDVKASAYIAPDKQEIIAVLINNNSQIRNIAMSFSDFNASSTEIYETVYQEGENKFMNIGPVPDNNVISISGESVMTVRFMK